MHFNYRPGIEYPFAILDVYREMQRLPKEMYALRYQMLVRFCQMHQDELYDLVFSGAPTDKELDELIMFGRAHGGSCRMSGSPEWQPFFQRVYARKAELPDAVQRQMQWLHRTHGW